MEIRSAIYVNSFSKVTDCPTPKEAEIAFIGRSNVGKSSLINAFCGLQALAYTSSQPGKTQSINFYLVNDGWYLVDLPGYGYARVSKTQRAAWGDMVQRYLSERPSLHCVFQLIDASIPPQQADLDFSNWLGEQGIPFVLVFTKADKKKKTKLKTQEAYLAKMEETWNTLPASFTTSAMDKRGLNELRNYVGAILPN
jgi:GTP-binding protein